jgi:hypothetical protein
MLARAWEAVKATLAVAALIAAALISADKLDREKSAAPKGAAMGVAISEPVITGAIPARR